MLESVDLGDCSLSSVVECIEWIQIIGANVTMSTIEV